MSSPVWIIAKKELASFFDSLTAYIMLVAFLGFSGFFTWLFGTDVFMRKEADLRVFFEIAKWTLFFFIPAITMKMLAEEKKSGTIELLLTKAISTRQIILGKFVGCMLLVGIALLFTIPYYYSISNLGNMDHGATISGYFGLLLMSAAYVGIGLFSSSITNNQIVAFLLALMIGIFFHFLFDAFAYSSKGFISQILGSLSVSRHYDSVSRGVIDTKDVFFFGSLSVLSLYLAELFISNRSK
ncbi:MAG: ABC transporter permease subunit [Bacteroidota bacterium]|nr:ABC transporter permease subunit [Bacteroidota bacterium]